MWILKPASFMKNGFWENCNSAVQKKSFITSTVTPQNVIRIAAKCNTNAKCNNIDAKCNKIFNPECNNLSTQIVITFLTHNVITQNVIISE